MDAVYVDSGDRKTMAELAMECGDGGTERSADEPAVDEPPPPPLPAKKKKMKSVGEDPRPDDGALQKGSRRRTADGRGVYVCRRDVSDLTIV